MLARLRHPSLVIVREPYLREGDRVCCVMDHAPGSTLAVASADGSVARERLLAALLEIGEALVLVHANGIVHRDVSPNNILIAADRPAILVDFDLVGGPAFARLTSTVPLGGTVPFVAPELLDGDDAPTAAADVYGLAMTALFVLLRGALTPSLAMRDPSSLLARDEVPHAIQLVLRAALDHDPARRTATVAAFCRSLKHALEHPQPGPAAPTFTTEGALILWTSADDPPPGLASAGLRLWPAVEVERHLREDRRDGTDLDRLRPYPALLTAATVLALRGQRPAWIGLTPHHTPVLVMVDGHLVLHDDGVPDPDDLQLARAHAVYNAPVALLRGGSARGRDVLDLAQEIRRGAHDERNLRELARFSKSPEAHEGLTPFVDDASGKPVAAVDTLCTAVLAEPAVLGLVGVVGSGKTHTLRLLAARLAHSAMTAGTTPVVLVDASGWQPPLQLSRLLQAQYTTAAAAATLLAVSSGECVLLVDGLDAPGVAIDAEFVVSQIRRAFPVEAVRIVLTASPALALPVHRGFQLSPLPGAELRGFRTRLPASQAKLVQPSLEQQGWASLLDVPRLALHLFNSPQSDAGGSLAPALAQYVQLWTRHLAQLFPRATAEQFGDTLENLAAAIWFGHDELHGDAIPFDFLRAACPVPGMAELLVDGTLLTTIARRTVTARWLAREAARRTATPIRPFRRHEAPPTPPEDFVHFVHDSILEWLIACRITRRLAAGDLTALRGARPTAMLRAFCPHTPHWPQAGERLAHRLRGAEPIEDREHALLLALGDPALASTLEQPWRLAGVQLANLDLTGVRLVGADLTGACLMTAILRGATLTGAVLVDADLAHADMRSANCDGVTATAANFTGAKLDGVSWRGADLRGAVFTASRSPRKSQDFTDARLDGIDTTGAFWHDPVGHPALPAGADHPTKILDPLAFAWLLEARWTRDGRRLVTIDSLGNVVVWHAELLQPLACWHATEFGQTHLELAADDRTLVVWTEGAAPRLWDLHTQAECHPGALVGVPTNSAAWAPHGDTLALCAADGSLWLWRPDQPPQRREHFPGGQTVRFLDDDRLAIYAVGPGTFTVYDLCAGRPSFELAFQPAHRHHAGFAVSPRGVVFRGLQSVTIHLFPSLAPVEAAGANLQMSHDAALDWSPDGHWIVATLESGPCLWSVEDGQWSHFLQHRDASRYACLRFSPNGRHVVGVREGGGLTLWDTATGRLLASHQSTSNWVHSVALSADHRTILAASDHQIRRWDPATLSRGPTIPYKDEFSVALAPDAAAVVFAVERKLVLADAQGTRVLDRCVRTDHAAWDRGHFTCDGRFFVARIMDNDRQELAAWDRTGARVCTVSLPHDILYQDHTIAVTRSIGICGGQTPPGKAIIDLYQDTAPIRIPAPGMSIHSLALDAGEQILAAAAEGPRIVLWDLPRCLSGTNTPLGELTTDWQLIDQLRFAPHGLLLAAASGDAVYLFDAGSGKRLRKLSGHGFRIRSVAFSGDSRHLIAGDWSGQLRVWSVASGELVATFHLLAGESSVVVSGGRCCALGEGVDFRGWFGTIADSCYPLAAFPAAVVPPDALAAALSWDT